jgi:hypothetical protein
MLDGAYSICGSFPQNIKETIVLITYIGTSGLRTVGKLTWSKENNFTTKVAEAEQSLGLLTLPREQFAIAKEELLLQVVNEDAAKVLLLAGIASVTDLAAIDGDEEVKALAAEIGCTLKELRGWIKSADALIK